MSLGPKGELEASVQRREQRVFVAEGTVSLWIIQRDQA